MNNKTRPMDLQMSQADILGPADDKMHDLGHKETQTKVGKFSFVPNQSSI